MKTCSKCNVLKEYSEFGKSSQVKCGYKSACKDCLRVDNRNYYINNREKESQRKKKQYKRDSDKIIAQQLEYYNKNKDYRSQWVKDKRKAKPEVFKEYGRKYRSDNRESVNSYHLNRRKTDILYKLKCVLRNRLLEALKYKTWNKNTNFSKYIGCTLEELKLYLENQFQPSMTWENHSKTGWHIDHIVPLDSAKTEEELYKLCHYTNLQPLWAIDNLRKSNKLK